MVLYDFLQMPGVFCTEIPANRLEKHKCGASLNRDHGAVLLVAIRFGGIGHRAER